ncbi:MAG: MBL fold metallo-hydrolase [Bacillaceae bacterium G1]|nr:MBL fold metallo-hydrolase [Bacillota bacterium]OJF16756.1 MAG: MBL fold metallo-hydrolase [Bacillaceae bacterium G1]
MSQNVVDLGHGISLIDLYDMGFENRTGCYVFREERVVLETGPSPSIPHLLDGLKTLNIAPESIRYIIVTHIHLDHSGGAGRLLTHCPNAQVVVHPRGARHLIDPSRLIASAKVVYGEKFDQFFHPIVPVPEDRILTRSDGDTLTIGPERTLQFLDTPGHALHHFSVYDPVSNGIFSGDTAGIRYNQLEEEGIPFFLPTTSPNQFDPEAMRASIERFRAMHIDRLYFGHYGMTTLVDEAFRQVTHWLDRFVALGQQFVAQHDVSMENIAKQTFALANQLMQAVRDHLTAQGVAANHRVYDILTLDSQVDAMGILDYLLKTAAKS